MKQISIFNTSFSPSDQWKLFIDGAARGNPGPAGVGIYVTKSDTDIIKKGFYVGNKTNNQAEYLALLMGIYLIKQKIENISLLIYSDSELLVKQMNGIYAVKNPLLKQLYDCSQYHLKPFSYTIEHITRDKNNMADQLANQGIDKKNKVPADFLTFCSFE